MVKKRILVAGGAGFLGSHLCKHLLESGEGVVCLDNFSTGSESNIANFLEDPNFELLRGDVCLPVDIEVDRIYSLACPASPAQYQRNPIQTTKTSVYGAINLLELAKRLGVPILQASTSEVYGDPSINPQPEEYWGNVNCTGIRACYDEGKRCAESIFFDYHRHYGVDIRVARIFNTYGTNMAVDDGRVVSNFIVQALRGEHLTIYGTGEQTRAFCYINDMIAGLVLLMEAENIHKPVNLGNPNEITIKELAMAVMRVTKSHSKIVHRPSPQDDPMQRLPDIARAKNLLNWSPKVRLDQGLLQTANYFKRKLEG